MCAYRLESDSVGEMRIPEDAYYGIQSYRAKNNFHITDVVMSKPFIRSMVLIKKAAAVANCQAGTLDEDKAGAIVAACDDVLDGKHMDAFIVGAVQGGAGTSANMNVNEVIANIATVKLGGKPGDYSFVHPNDHVNMGQSTNDVIPTAGKLTTIRLIHKLLGEIDLLYDALMAKAREFDDILKMGRTQLQDAVPMRLGQSFFAFAHAIKRDRKRIERSLEEMTTLNMGATAIGSGINADPGYFASIIRVLSDLTGEDLSRPRDLFDATQNIDCFAAVSGALKTHAINLSKMCNDLRLMSSGPRTGFGEINLPAKQNGSSIMPGKVNPVIPEVVNQTAFLVIGHDVTITMAAEAGQLELNAFEPIVFYQLFESITALTGALNTLRINCIDGITANREKCEYYVTHSVGIVTALNPYLGYKKSAEIAKASLKTGKSIKEIVLEDGLMDEETLNQVLDAHKMTEPMHS